MRPLSDRMYYSCASLALRRQPRKWRRRATANGWLVHGRRFSTRLRSPGMWHGPGGPAMLELRRRRWRTGPHRTAFDSGMHRAPFDNDEATFRDRASPGDKQGPRYQPGLASSTGDSGRRATIRLQPGNVCCLLGGARPRARVPGPTLVGHRQHTRQQEGQTKYDVDEVLPAARQAAQNPTAVASDVCGGHHAHPGLRTAFGLAARSAIR